MRDTVVTVYGTLHVLGHFAVFLVTHPTLYDSPKITFRKVFEKKFKKIINKRKEVLPNMSIFFPPVQ